MRIGQGYDVHRFASPADARALVLGGAVIPYERGLLGHSDADVLTHAIIDAILGAAAMGDIGKLFPDTDEQFRDADSLQLLRRVCGIVRFGGFQIGNIDSTLVAQAPKMAMFIPEMRRRIAGAAEVNIARVSVKATTEEGLGFTGKGLGISAQAVVLLTE